MRLSVRGGSLFLFWLHHIPFSKLPAATFQHHSAHAGRDSAQVQVASTFQQNTTLQIKRALAKRSEAHPGFGDWWDDYEDPVDTCIVGVSRIIRYVTNRNLGGQSVSTGLACQRRCFEEFRNFFASVPDFPDACLWSATDASWHMAVTDIQTKVIFDHRDELSGLLQALQTNVYRFTSGLVIKPFGGRYDDLMQTWSKNIFGLGPQDQRYGPSKTVPAKGGHDLCLCNGTLWYDRIYKPHPADSVVIRQSPGMWVPIGHSGDCAVEKVTQRIVPSSWQSEWNGIVSDNVPCDADDHMHLLPKGTVDIFKYPRNKDSPQRMSRFYISPKADPIGKHDFDIHLPNRYLSFF